jgi:hypothetical protein
MFPVYAILALLGFYAVVILLALALKVILRPFRFLNRPSISASAISSPNSNERLSK